MGDQPLWERVVGGHFVLAKRSFWPNFFSQIVARLQWNPMAIDLAPDARAWPELPDERRRRLTTLLAGFCVAEDAVADHLTPFADAAREATLASQESLMAWVFFLQRRDEQRHARLFDRIGAEVLGMPGYDPAERRAAARAHVTPAMLELFEERLPAMAADLAAGETCSRTAVPGRTSSPAWLRACSGIRVPSTSRRTHATGRRFRRNVASAC
jgi:ribonucleoside-diphosphate reductase beta chain